MVPFLKDASFKTVVENPISGFRRARVLKFGQKHKVLCANLPQVSKTVSVNKKKF